jgi:hypothetical protein
MDSHGKKNLKLRTFLEKTSFMQIFAIWLCIVILFGTAYFLLSSSTGNSLISRGDPLVSNTEGFFDSIYFSFITATTLGYGDISPSGISKLFATLEAIIGLIMFGIIVSKVVSVKQDVVLEEIYDISFKENLNRLRSALYLFREDLNKIIFKIENKYITAREINDLWVVMTTLDTTLIDTYKVLCPERKAKHEYYKTVDGMRLELIFNSIRLSLSRLLDLLLLLNRNGYSWKNSSMVGSIKNNLEYIENITQYYSKKSLDKKNEEKLAEIMLVKDHILEQLSVEMPLEVIAVIKKPIRNH